MNIADEHISFQWLKLSITYSIHPSKYIHMPFKVEVWERDIMQAPELLKTRTFDTIEKALQFQEKINSKNTAKFAPDYYVQAEDPEEIK